MSTHETTVTRDETEAGMSIAAEPALPEQTLRHLGSLLTTAYEPPDDAAEDARRFDDLLAALAAALAGFHDARETEFRAGLLATIPALRRFAISLIRDRVAADDLVQDTLLRAWRNRTSFALGTNLEAWLFTILRNKFYSDRRKNREVQDEDDAKAARLAVLPEQIDHIELADVQAALARLAAPMREALLLVAIQGMSYEDAAAVMECQVGTVKSRVWRARDQLARMLGDAAEVGQDPLMLSAVEGAA